MNAVVIGRQKFTGPSSWDEITPRQFLEFLGWRVRLGGEPAGRWILLQLWYGIRYVHTRLLDDEQRLFLLSHLDFLDERPERWVLPKLRVKVRQYVGPGDGLEYLTFGEFIRAQAARDKYLATPDPKHLSELVASLYRPKALLWQPKGEAGRTLFDIREYGGQCRKMVRLPETVLQGVLMNYEGCLDQFPVQFPHLFGRSDESESGGTWLDVGLSLARQTNALGTFHELERSDLFLVLTTLDALMKENKDLAAKYKQHD